MAGLKARKRRKRIGFQAVWPIALLGFPVSGLLALLRQSTQSVRYSLLFAEPLKDILQTNPLTHPTIIIFIVDRAGCLMIIFIAATFFLSR
ncbi:MAG: hypothetical protein ACR2PT_11715 [Endozoicomonas sp.]